MVSIKFSLPPPFTSLQAEGNKEARLQGQVESSSPGGYAHSFSASLQLQVSGLWEAL